eukprot:3046751-Amphidinium_carterae.2
MVRSQSAAYSSWASPSHTDKRGRDSSCDEHKQILAEGGAHSLSHTGSTEMHVGDSYSTSRGVEGGGAAVRKLPR